ncbi:hypothetical protein MalM25_23750 [Planctomycetes bacterium MalM25]|nr:hypothetical protein MalM25_23750 [Planctomycetes bacterium MalM25]
MSRRTGTLDRRTLLRGAGVACALPYLEAMCRGSAPVASEAPRRLCCVYFPNGVSLPSVKEEEYRQYRWFPEGEGADYKTTNTLRPLDAHRDQLTVLGGLSHPKSRALLGHLAGDTWLTGGDLRGSAYRNQVSVDQVAARTLGRDTRYKSLVLSTDGGVGYKSRIATLSFADGGRPLPAEHRQRLIFERYFAAGTKADIERRRQSLGRGQKVIDLVLDDARSMRRGLGRADQQRLDEYLSAVNSVEEQIRRNERWLNKPLQTPDMELDLDVAAAADPQGYLRAMFDLMVLAFQTDLTRVTTFMMGREDGMGFAENFPKLGLGLKKGHHTITHDKNTGHWAEWGAYDRWLTEQFAYFVERLHTVEDAHGPLLDRTLVLYGSACSSTHNARNYPLVLAGGSDFGVQHGAYRRPEEETPMANLLLALLQTLGCPEPSFAESTEPYEAIHEKV